MRTTVARGVTLLLLLSAPSLFGLVSAAVAQGTSPFTKLAGRWLGEGRLGYAGGKTETVKCRVTYVVTESKATQTIRCSTEGDRGNRERLQGRNLNKN
jgi:hypothetical protein